jgi:hypothetical protein
MTMYNHETKVPRQKGIKHYIYGTPKKKKAGRRKAAQNRPAAAKACNTLKNQTRAF